CPACAFDVVQLLLGLTVHGDRNEIVARTHHRRAATPSPAETAEQQTERRASSTTAEGSEEHLWIECWRPFTRCTPRGSGGPRGGHGRHWIPAPARRGRRLLARL